MPKICSLISGYFSYDSIRYIEKIPNSCKNDLNLPDVRLMRPRTLVIHDNLKKEIYYISNVFNDEKIKDYQKKYDSIKTDLFKLLIQSSIKNINKNRALKEKKIKVKSNTSKNKFLAMVNKAKKYIKLGDIFQVVLSQRFEAKLTKKPLEIYKKLRVTNPSPFMFYFNFNDFQIIGASPEILVRLRDNKITVRPIAGTRPRGKNKKEDLTNSLNDLIMTGRDPAIFVSARVITHLLQDPQLGKKLRLSIKDSTTPETLEAVMIALGAKEMNPDSNLDFFVNYLKDDDPEIRELSIRCLSHCQEANLYDLLEETIKDEENRVSLAAMNALMDAPLEDAPTGELVSYLEDALVNTDIVVRKTAFELLGHAGNADDFEPALAMLGEALSGLDTIRREAVAEALGSIAPDNGVANVARRQGYVSKWMVLGTFLNDKEHKAFAEELEPEKSIDFEKTYPSKYVWALQGNQRRDGEKAIEREIGWSEASVNKTNGMLLMGPLLPPPGTFSIAYAVSDFTCSKDQELLLSLDGDDAFKVWLNGEKIAEAIAPYLHRQSCVATLENIKIKLKKGKNRILIKSANIENEWWVRARITDANNRPVELF